MYMALFNDETAVRAACGIVVPLSAALVLRFLAGFFSSPSSSSAWLSHHSSGSGLAFRLTALAFLAEAPLVVAFTGGSARMASCFAFRGEERTIVANRSF